MYEVLLKNEMVREAGTLAVLHEPNPYVKNQVICIKARTCFPRSFFPQYACGHPYH